MEFWASFTSAIGALAAAALWFKSAAERIPADLDLMLSGPKSAAGYMQRQSRLSAWAAICAGLAALAQIVAWIAQHYPHLSFTL